MEKSSPLAMRLAGVKLLEASAGTGKTHTITLLYLRLLIEKKLRPEQILVVTFTEAAAAELRGRIRKRLQSTLAFLENSPAPGDPENQNELDFLATLGLDTAELCTIIKKSLLHFDLAAISTIHGFCHRIIKEYAFEGGTSFDFEISGETTPLQVIIDDYWRRLQDTAEETVLAFLHHKKISSDSLYPRLASLVRFAENFGMDSLIPAPPHQPPPFTALVTGLAQIWRSQHQIITECIASHKGVSRARDAYTPDNLESWSKTINTWAADDAAILPFDALESFRSSLLARKTRKNTPPPAHIFFDLCEDLFSNLEEYVLFLHGDLVSHCRRQWHRIKLHNQILTYDDLLTLVRDFLKNSPASQKKLASRVRERFPAALIDEFQDTDLLQYEIFKTLYSDCPQQESLLVLIGDPKQAIYSFRGADIYTYIMASRQADRFNLTTSYRSDPSLTAAVNHLFSQSNKPFLLPEIQYLPVTHGGQQPKLEIAGEPDQPLRIICFDDGAIAGQIKNTIADEVAREISTLLHAGIAGNGRLGETALKAEHIAILVRKNSDGELIRKALSRHGIKAASSYRDTVLKSPEAFELQLILNAIADPLDTAALKTALATPMYGAKAAEIHALTEDEKNWSAISTRFIHYHRLWHHHGFIAMMRCFIKDEGIYPKQLAFELTERRITNLNHLTEILHHISQENGFRPEETLAWLQEARAAERSGDDAELIRLESDEKLVHIVTIHKSKGLEYPIVFCPFLWEGTVPRKSSGKIISFHDETDTLRADFGSEQYDAHWHLQTRELFAEDMRLLYVALTRAKNRCYIYWGKVMSNTTIASLFSGLGFLFHPPADTGTDFVTARKSFSKNMSVEELLRPAFALAQQFPDAFQVTNLTRYPGPAPLQSGKIVPALQPQRQYRRQHLAGTGEIVSFSKLHQHDGEAAAREHSLSADSSAEPPTTLSIFTFPRGSRAGNCIHSIFENLDFTGADKPGIARTVSENLNLFGFDNRWTQVLTDNIDHTLHVQLAPEFPGLSLARIPRENRLPELEFYFPITQADILRKKNLLLETIRSEISPPVGEQTKRADFMRGFIDLVFCWEGRYFLLDYKSNYLGDSPEDYHHPALHETILAAEYDLQYTIYTITLDRYLQHRLADYDYDTHLGGIFYLFTRGITSDTTSRTGIYRARLDRDKVAACNRFFGNCNS